MATVYAVASAKGGVGKTTTTAAIATILAESGADVVAIDADIGMANLAGALGVTPGETTIHDVLADRAVPLDAVHDGPAGLRVVPGAADLDAYAAADPSGLKDVVAAFDDADYVFIDAGAGLSHDSTLPLGLAAETLLVSTPEPSALGDTEKTRQLTERLGGSVAGAAITRVSDAAEDSEIESEDETESEGQDDTETDDVVAELLDATVLGRIPEDEAVLLAAEAGAPLPMFAPDSPATRAYRDLAQALTDTEIDGSGLGVGSAVGATADETREDERERGEDRPAESDGEETGESDGEETGESDGEEAGESAGEDIIVADSEQAGLGEPHSEEDIIVADESPVTERDGDEQERHEAKEPEGGDEAADAVSGASDVTTTTDTVDDETEMVGRDHVNGDDLEAMIEDDLDEAAFDDDSDDSDDNATAADEDVVQEPTAGDEPGVIADADEVASTADGNEAGDPDEREVDDDGDSQDDIDDELAGSVPFRDDDTGTTSTALSESDDDGTESGDTTDEADEADETEQTDDTKRGGFFSRLLGR